MGRGCSCFILSGGRPTASNFEKPCSRAFQSDATTIIQILKLNALQQEIYITIKIIYLHQLTSTY